MSFKLADALVYLGVKRDNLDRDLSAARQSTESWATAVGSGIAIALGDRLVGAVQNGIQTVGRLGKTMWDFSVDSRRAVGNLQAQLGSSREEAELLGEVARRVWANNFGENVLAAADAVGQVRLQLRSLNAEQIQQVTQSGLAIVDIYGEDLPKYISAVRTLMETMGLSHQQAMDFIAAGFQRGLNRSDDFLDSINEYAPQFQSMQADAGQFFSVLESGLQGGVLGTDKAADMIKEFRVRLLDGSETTAEGLRQLGLSIDDISARINDGSLTWSDAFGLITGKLRETDDQSVQMQAGVALLGTQFEDLGIQAALGVDLAATSLAELDGSSETLAARYNNLEDALSGMGRQMVAALSPATDVFVTLINDNLPKIDSLFQRLAANAALFSNGVVAILRGISRAFGAFFTSFRRDSDSEFATAANNAGGWGRNIVVQLAKGMASGAVAVVQILNQLAGIITYWLKPGSPPKLLPNIDKWGAGAMQAWLDGFGSADVGVLKGITGKIQGILGGLGSAGDVRLVDTIFQSVSGLLRSKAKDDDTGLVGRLLGSKQAIATAVSLIQRTGDVGGAAFGLVEQALRPLPAAARDYTRAMLELHLANDRVAKAQERLNRITSEYSDRLRPLQKELADLQRQQDDESDAKRIAELQRAIARGALTDEEKVLAARELRELQLRRQIRGIEAEQDAAVSAAQAELDKAEAQQKAAQETADFQEAMLAAQQANNDLIGEQVSLLAQLAEKLAGVGSALSDLAGGGGLGDALGLDNLDGIDLGEDPLGLGADGLGLGTLFEDVDIQGTVDEILAQFEPLQTEMQALGETTHTLRDAWDGWLERLGITENGQLAIDILGGLKDAVIVLGAAVAGAKLAALFSGIWTAITTLGAGQGIIAGIGAAVTALGGPFIVLAALVAGVTAIMVTDFLGIRSNLEMLWSLTREIFRLIGQWMAEKIEEAGAKIETALLKVREWFTVTLPTAWEEAKTALKEKLAAMRETVTGWRDKTVEALDKIKEKFDHIKTAVLQPFKQAWDDISDTIGWFLDRLGAIKDGLSGLEIPDFLQRHSPPPLAQSFTDIADAMQRLSQTELPVFRRELGAVDVTGTPVANSLDNAHTGQRVGAGGQVTVVFEAGSVQLADEGMIELFFNYLRGLADQQNDFTGGALWP